MGREVARAADVGRPPGLITLLTDFGTADGYVAAMKGVIACRAPEARVVDITHEIPPHDIRRGGFVWGSAWPWFPPGTIHVAVVDPGVGSARAIIALKTRRGIFLAPDNGILAYAVERRDVRSAVSVESSEHRLEPTSATFHGRDIFAPAAAALAMGTPIDDLGPRVELRALVWPARARARRRTTLDVIEWRGEVVDVDRFGNVTTNIPAPESGVIDAFELEVARTTIRGLRRAYAEVEPGELLVLVGSSGWVEVAVSGGSAARVLGIERGEGVRVRYRERPPRGRPRLTPRGPGRGRRGPR
ncbi:MAG TPA: SAM-dependent chlorinase/fluorinase [Planctomycetota bacterium]|nr:SAM-dependent chlorinase/fluorinase [Planctomycetota bacterium]